MSMTLARLLSLLAVLAFAAGGEPALAQPGARENAQVWQSLRRLPPVERKAVLER